MVHRRFILALFLLAVTAVSAAESYSGLPDPTRPIYLSGKGRISDDSGSKKTALSLDSILISPGYRAAIINGRLLKEGEKIGQSKVSAIHANKVELSQAGERTTLVLVKSASVTEVKGGRN